MQIPNVDYTKRNVKVLASLSRTAMRSGFWQALRNWSGFNFFWVGYKMDTITFDTFNFEGRNG